MIGIHLHAVQSYGRVLVVHDKNGSAVYTFIQVTNFVFVSIKAKKRLQLSEPKKVSFAQNILAEAHYLSIETRKR